MKNYRKGNAQPTINASSMADVAFLLLIFFLVVTTIDVDKGITVKLPPWCEENCGVKIDEERVLNIKLNSKDQLLVNRDEIELKSLRTKTEEFLLTKKEKAIISLQNDRSTSYDTYLSVYNELKAAYNDVWQQEALAVYNSSFKGLSSTQKKKIREKYPMVISEAESSDIAINN